MRGWRPKMVIVIVRISVSVRVRASVHVMLVSMVGRGSSSNLVSCSYSSYDSAHHHNYTPLIISPPTTINHRHYTTYHQSNTPYSPNSLSPSHPPLIIPSISPSPPSHFPTPSSSFPTLFPPPQ